MISRRALTMLVTAAVLFPLAIVVVGGAARLLGAMQDTAAAAVVDRLALALCIAWAIDLLALLLAVGINALGPPGPGSA